jgi:hypothetical protein
MKYSNQNTIIRNQMIEDGPKDSFKNLYASLHKINDMSSVVIEKD